MELEDIFRLALKGEKKTLLKLAPYLQSPEISYDKLEASIINGFILNRLGRFDEAKESLRTLRLYYSHIEQSFYRKRELNQREAELFCLFLLVKAFRNIKLGYLDEGEILLEHANTIIPKIKDDWTKRCFSGIYNNEMGLSYWKMGKYEESIKYHEYAVTILSKPINEILGIAYNDQAISYYEIGNYRQSLHVLEIALPILKENNSIQDYGYAIGNMGRVYRAMGDIEKAKEYALESLKIKEMVGNHLDLAVECRNLAMLAFYEENYQESHEFLLRSLTYRLKIDNPIEIADSYFYLILLAFEWKNSEILSIERMNYYLHELRDLSKSNDHKLINDQYRLANALFLKNDRIEPTDKGRAIKILQELVEEKEMQSDVRFTALSQICWILIDNLRIERDPNDLRHIQQNIDILMYHAKNNHLYGLMIQVLILKSRFLVLENKNKEAKETLIHAEEISNKKALKFLKNKVEREIEKFTKYLAEIQLHSNSTNLDQSLEILEVEKYLKSISTGLNIMS